VEPEVYQRALELLAVDLYRLETLTLGQAAELAGMPLGDFIDLCGRLRVPVLWEPKGGIGAEVEALAVTAGSRDSVLAELRIVIREGRHRQVRRMVHAIGHKVHSLRRTGFGPLKLGRLKTGGWRVLGEAEVAALRRAVGEEAG